MLNEPEPTHHQQSLSTCGSTYHRTQRDKKRRTEDLLETSFGFTSPNDTICHPLFQMFYDLRNDEQRGKLKIVYTEQKIKDTPT